MPPFLGDTLLPPPCGYADDSGPYADTRDSSRSLGEIGTLAVLGAMVEQRRRASTPAACEVGDSALLRDDDGDLLRDDDGDLHDDDDDSDDAVATQRRPAVDPSCDVFMKIR